MFLSLFHQVMGVKPHDPPDNWIEEAFLSLFHQVMGVKAEEIGKQVGDAMVSIPFS